MNIPVDGTDEMITRFCYKIDAKAKMTQDDEGNDTDCYMEFKLTHTKEISLDRFNHMHDESLRENFANQMGIPQEWLIPITEEEHDENVD